MWLASLITPLLLIIIFLLWIHPTLHISPTPPLSFSPTDHEPYCCCESCAHALLKVPENSAMVGTVEQKTVKWSQVASFAENNITNTRGIYKYHKSFGFILLRNGPSSPFNVETAS